MRQLPRIGVARSRARSKLHQTCVTHHVLSIWVHLPSPSMRQGCGPSAVRVHGLVAHVIKAVVRAARGLYGQHRVLTNRFLLQGVILAAAVLAGLRPDAIASVSRASSLAATCLSAALRASDPRCVHLCSIAAAAVANKAGALHSLLTAMHDGLTPATTLHVPGDACKPVTMRDDCVRITLQAGRPARSASRCCFQP